VSRAPIRHGPDAEPESTARVAEYWWLASILLPVGSFGFGILLGLTGPRPESDWYGGAIFARFFATLFCGCAGGCIAGIVSFWRKEKRAYISILPGLLSLAFVCWMIFASIQAKDIRKRQAISTAKSYKKQDEDWSQKKSWKTELRAHPELITNDDFWKTHQDPARNAYSGLFWLLQDKTFVVTPEIRAYVIRNFPDAISTLFQAKRFTTAELQSLATDPGARRDLRELAVRTLMEDDSFDFTSEWKERVRHDFPQLIRWMVTGKKLTKTELEELDQDPKTTGQLKSDVQFYLQHGYFRQ